MISKKTLCYLGETIDYSDKWFISFLAKKYIVTTISPSPDVSKSLQQLRMFDIIVNRLYTSAVRRHGIKTITYLVTQLKKNEGTGGCVINSSRGYLIDLDRIKQYHFFKKHNIQFVPVYTTSQALTAAKHINYPVVLKFKTSGRNKQLTIIQNAHDLRSRVPSHQRTKVVVQPLIKNTICYRTECIGTVAITFPQRIHIRNNHLSFQHIPRIIKAPIQKEFINYLIKTLEEIGVQAFSIEYFLINSTPHIIDFNLTSNYTSFLIRARGAQIKKGWLDIIHGFQ